MTFTEKQLREAAHCAAEAIADGFPDVPESEHEFSPAFERKMEKLLRKMHRRPYVRTLQRAAAFFLAFLAAGSIWLSTDVQARDAFIGWVQEQYDRFQTYFFYEGASGNMTEIDVEYVPTNIPEGYALETETKVQNSHVITRYCNGEGEYLSIMWFDDSEASHLFIYTENAAEKKVSVNGIRATFYYYENEEHSNTIVWIDPQTDMLLCVDGWFPESDLVKIAESITFKFTN